MGAGFTEYLTIENPDPVNDCSVNIEYLLGTGSPVTKSVTVPHASRFTESVNSDLNVSAGSGNYQTDAAIVSVSNASTCAGVVAETTDVLYATSPGSAAAAMCWVQRIPGRPSTLPMCPPAATMPPS